MDANTIFITVIAGLAIYAGSQTYRGGKYIVVHTKHAIVHVIKKVL